MLGGKEMVIQLGENYRIFSESNTSVILEERKVGTKGASAGVEKWDFVGSYPTLEWAVNAIVRKGIQTPNIEGIQNIINLIKTSVAELSGQIRVLQEETT
jgi:hypothetical protein